VNAPALIACDYFVIGDKRTRTHCSIAGKRGDQGADLQVCIAKNKSTSKISIRIGHAQSLP
jgi:hypothetical protein